MARIVIDARMVNESGIGRYLRNLIDGLQELDKKNEYFILLLKKDFDTLDFGKKFTKVLADFRWYTLEEQIRLSRILKRIDADLVHFPHFNVPYFYDGKFVVTIHDLIHQSFSMDRSTRTPIVYGLKHLGYKKIFGNALNKSEKVLVPSQYVKSQLMNKWKIDNRKIMITPEGVDTKLYTIVNTLSKSQNEDILRKFSIKPPYIFYIGNAHPHKNIEGLIKAFLRLKDSGLRQNDMGDLKLVLSGQDNFFWKKIRKDSRFRGNDIVYTGYVTEEELVVLYKNAKAFVMPSFEEGFGLPILEAFALDCPVVSSNAASLPEVGGNAAIYFNPLDTFDVSSKIDQVLDSEKLRKELIEKGKKRVKQFSWQKMIEQTLEVYQKCV